MPIHNTIRNSEQTTEKPTMTIDDDWSAAMYWNEEKEESDPTVHLLIESLDERFELVLYVTDKKKLAEAFNKFLQDLQELYIE